MHALHDDERHNVRDDERRPDGKGTIQQGPYGGTQRSTDRGQSTRIADSVSARCSLTTMGSTMRLDHMAWANASMDEALAQFTQFSGVAPQPGGAHQGAGTQNAILRIGNAMYLALDAPDPSQSAVGNNGERLLALPAPETFIFVMAVDDLEPVEAALDREQIAHHRRRGHRRRPDGQVLESEVVVPDSPEWGAAIPNVVRWVSGSHPSADAPGVPLVEFAVYHPRSSELADLYTRLGISVPVRHAEDFFMHTMLKGSKGYFTLPTRAL